MDETKETPETAKAPNPARCQHEADKDVLRYNAEYGLETVCKKCGARLIIERKATLRHGREHMSKKERLRRRKALAEHLAESAKVVAEKGAGK